MKGKEAFSSVLLAHATPLRLQQNSDFDLVHSFRQFDRPFRQKSDISSAAELTLVLLLLFMLLVLLFLLLLLVLVFLLLFKKQPWVI